MFVFQIYFSHSNVHSKLRNGTTKGRNSRVSNTSVLDKVNIGSSITSGNGGSPPSSSPTSLLPQRQEKRKSKEEATSPSNVENDITVVLGMVNASGISLSSSGGELAPQPQSLINPVTGLNVQINTNNCKTVLPSPISPILMECPEQDCSKKYKHANGLLYHQSHAHGSTSLLDEDVLADTEERILTPSPSPVSSAPTTVESHMLPHKQDNGSEAGTTLTNVTDIFVPLDKPISAEEESKLSENSSYDEHIITQSKHCNLSSASSDTVSQSNLARVADSVNNKLQMNTPLPSEHTNHNMHDKSSPGKNNLIKIA